MNITNNNISIDDSNIYNASSPAPKAVDGKAFVSFLADELASQPGSFSAESAESARDVLTKQMNQDPMFMAGTGLKGLGYTFLLLQTFAELEMDMIKNANKQSALTSQMYEKLSEAEFRIADDIWKSGLAKGISQIAGGATQLGFAGLSAFKQNRALKETTATVNANPTNSQANSSSNLSATEGRAAVQGNVTPSNLPVNPPANAQASNASASAGAAGAQSPPPSANTNANHAPTNKRLSKAKQRELANIKEDWGMYGRTANEFIIGGGSIASAYYDADGKKEEGLKHLIQMVINNADTQKQRLQQQYDEASKKMEEAIQAYNAAAQASH